MVLLSGKLKRKNLFLWKLFTGPGQINATEGTGEFKALRIFCNKVKVWGS